MYRSKQFKFRGKSKNGWIYGDLIHNREKVYIAPLGIANPLSSPDDFVVDENTVCQYTGFDDVDGTEIYDGDLVYSTCNEEESEKVCVGYYNCLLAFMPLDMYGTPRMVKPYDFYGYKVAGNIFDNNLK